MAATNQMTLFNIFFNLVEILDARWENYPADSAMLNAMPVGNFRDWAIIQGLEFVAKLTLQQSYEDP